ncbi:MAG: hypothetical protein Q7J21_02315, partial [Rugosibacter sp.]|nr:hypothetical protein [Rugosibacter sp.]
LRTEASLARARVRHYYVERFFDPAFWRKLLRGGVGLRASIGEYVSQRRVARCAIQTGSTDFITQTLDGLHRFPGALLVVLSGRDLVAQEFMDTLARDGDMPLFSKPDQIVKNIPNADHTFSQSASRVELEAAVLEWLETAF